MHKLIFMLPLAVIALSGCGRGGGVSAGASNSGASTSAISSYMSKEYSTEQMTFRANLQALENIEASKDIECTEHELTAVTNLKKEQVQTFLNGQSSHLSKLKNQIVK